MTRQRGSAMILTISILAGLVALVASFAASEAAEIKARTNRVEKLRAELLAESGLQRALAELSIPMENPASTTPQDAWVQLGQYGNNRFLMDGGSFRIEIVDACSLVNLNTATEDQLYRLPLTTEQIDSLQDWRSNDDTSRPEGGRDEYYNQLYEPYNAALTNLQTVDELLLIKGFTGPTLYRQPTEQVNTQYLAGTQQELQPVLAQLVTVLSTAPELGGAGAAKADIATATAVQLVQLGVPQGQALAIQNARGGFQKLGDAFNVPGIDVNTATILLDNFQFGANPTRDGKINLNTASEAVLNTIPGFTPDVTQGVLSAQQTGLTSLGQFASQPGVTMQLLAQCADILTTTTQTFLVRVIGPSGRTSTAIEALVSVAEGTVALIQRNRPAFADPRSFWNWSLEPVSDIDLRTSL
ncbi:MAG: general secretion pathway protein GspK [Armatimonadetes bacterium]|nr:general secretion pathway protein GspK [Armatimonadota bacterium]